MNLLISCLAINIATVLWLQPASAEATFKVVRNVPYVARDSVRVGDVFLPATTPHSKPIIVFIHGGGWEGGQKEEVEPIAANLVDEGFIVYNINYRLMRQGGEFPGDVNDVKDALAFAALKARDWGGDPNRIGAIGTSAGGHLALMAAYAPNDIIAAPHYANSTAKAAAVVSWFGPTDLSELRGDLIDRYLVNEPGAYGRASPISYTATAVPTLLVHGTVDDLVPYQQSQKLLTKLQSRKVVATLHTVKGEGHGFNAGFDLAFSQTVHFFKQYL